MNSNELHNKIIKDAAPADNDPTAVQILKAVALVLRAYKYNTDANIPTIPLSQKHWDQVVAFSAHKFVDGGIEVLCAGMRFKLVNGQ
ncbi:hypothetical protein GCM10027051_31110 [Niabella terrae]